MPLPSLFSSYSDAIVLDLDSFVLSLSLELFGIKLLSSGDSNLEKGCKTFFYFCFYTEQFLEGEKLILSERDWLLLFVGSGGEFFLDDLFELLLTEELSVLFIARGLLGG